MRLTPEMREMVAKLPVETQNKLIKLEELMRLALARTVIKSLTTLEDVFSDDDDLVNPEIKSILDDATLLTVKLEKLFPAHLLDELQNDTEIQDYINS